MPRTYDGLEADARALPTADRSRLAQALTASLAAPRSHEEVLREVEMIAQGRSRSTWSDREQLEEAIARPFRARDRRIDSVESRIRELSARLEGLEARVGDGEMTSPENPRAT